MLAGGLLGSAFLVLLLSPVGFARLVAEDNWAESCTAASFALAGILLVAMASRPAPRARRALWIAVGVLALVVAAEEISWGQRLFDIPTPELFARHSTQNEISLHNLDLPFLLRHDLERYTYVLVLGLLTASAPLCLARPERARRLEATGWPLIRPQLLPLVLVALYFHTSFPGFRHSELAELALGIAALAGVADLSSRYELLPGPRPTRGPLARQALLTAVVAGIAILYTEAFSGWPNCRSLNNSASEGYARTGMHAQAEELRAYIAAHPDCEPTAAHLDRVASPGGAAVGRGSTE